MSTQSIVRRGRASLALMVASGFAGLGYQIVWTQQSSLWLGHESAAMLAVVAAFFGGLSLGAWALASRIEHSSRPVRWYAGCELVIAAWSLLLVIAMPPFSAWISRLTGAHPSPLRQWSLAFVGTCVSLLPATVAMGATLPAMERLTAHWEGRSIARLYAGNTLGALLGVLCAAFLLVPRFGLTRTALVCCALNVLCGVIAIRIFPQQAEAAPRAPRGSAPAQRGVLVRLACTGFLGIGYEVLVVRVLSQVSEDTVYTFALLLAVYLLGTAAGAAMHQRWLRANAGANDGSERLIGWLAAACTFGTASLWAAEWLEGVALPLLGDGVATAIVAEAVPALFAFGPATVLMGMLFSELSRRAHEAGIGFGKALGVNTLGAAVAPAVFGVLVLPSLGPKLALLLVDVGYVALIGRRHWSRAFVWAPAATAGLLAWFAPALQFVDVPEGGRVVSYRDGIIAAVSVVEDAEGTARLRINNRAQEGSSRTQRVDGRQAWLPVLLHPAPKHALFLGLGTGITASSAAEDPTLDVDAVELLPEVSEASQYFAHSFADGAAYARLHVLTADARRFVRASEQSYDVIVADNYHPARSGSGSLYAVEHFEAVRARLASGGLFCQWLPLHQLDRETLRSIVRSFLTVYPEGAALIASNSLETPVLGLIGARERTRFDPSAVRARLAHLALSERVEGIGLEDELAVLGSFVAGHASLERFAGDAPLNTDDHPVVTYHAPHVTYAPTASPGQRLIALLHELASEPSELLSPTAAPADVRRLTAYWLARTHFIESGRNVRPSSRVQDMLSQVRGPLVSVLHESPDFRPAYDPLLSMAVALAQSDAVGARALLVELTQLQPARGEAERALAMLASAAPARH